jgi:hypothetical protein
MLSNARTKIALWPYEVSRPQEDASRGLETSYGHKAILVRAALAQSLFQMAEPRRTGFYRNPNLKIRKNTVFLAQGALSLAAVV